MFENLSLKTYVFSLLVDIFFINISSSKTFNLYYFSYLAAACADADVLNKYQCGFRECVDEVKRYLHNVDGVDVDIRTRLLNHLANSVSAIGQSVTHAQTSEPATAHVRPLKTINKCEEENKSSTKKTNEQNNNNNNLQKSTQLVHNLNVPTSSNSLSSGINLVPQKFSRGEVAVVIPSNLLPGGNVPGYVIPIYASTQMNSAQLGFSSVPVGLATGTALLPSSEALLPNAPAYRFGTASSSIDYDKSSLILLSEKQSSPNQTSSNEHHRNSNKDCDSFNDQKEKGNHQVNPPEMNQNINVQNEEMWRPW